MSPVVKLWLAILWAFLCGMNLTNLATPFNLIVAPINAFLAFMYGAQVVAALKRIPLNR